MASALDFFGDSATVAASGGAPNLGKRKRQEIMDTEPESNYESSMGEGSDVESGEEEEGELNKSVIVEQQHGLRRDVPMTLLAGHAPMESEKGRKRKKRRKLTKETKQLLCRQEVCVCVSLVL